ncbi:MAG: DUF6089 family protein [Bacteroidales bacterium]|jgi:hypothetical protein|nr:DUF6089 family protein [Bacteroidales bacterium]
MIKRLALFLMLCCSFSLFGQYLEVGPFAGGSYYLGDLNPGKHFKMTNAAFGAIVRCNFTPRWVARINFMYGSVSGDDLVVKAMNNRNLNFASNIMEVSAQAEVNFLPYFTGSYKNRFTPYIFAGIGIFTMNPTTMIDGVKYNLVELGTEGQLSGSEPDRATYSLTQLCLPFGIGFRVSLGRAWCIGAEWGMRKTFTDYLDDCSKTYYLDSDAIFFTTISERASDPTQNHKQGMQRGNSEYNDWYNFMGFTVTYKINLFKKSNCSKFFSPYKDMMN